MNRIQLNYGGKMLYAGQYLRFGQVLSSTRTSAKSRIQISKQHVTIDLRNNDELSPTQIESIIGLLQYQSTAGDADAFYENVMQTAREYGYEPPKKSHIEATIDGYHLTIWER